MKKCLLLLLTGMLMLGACQQSEKGLKEDWRAKTQLQGTWVDAETEEVVFRAEGDTIFYTDEMSMPTYFRISDGQLFLGNDISYHIVKQTDNLFFFENQNGDVVKLNKSYTTQEEQFVTDQTPRTYCYTEVVKKDSVVQFGEHRYHWYIAINPTKYRVVKKAYNKDNMEVENVYYDNIIHLSIFEASVKLFSSDFRKQMFGQKVPNNFLEQAVLGNLEYSKADKNGLHFNATLCIPDDAQCYVVETVIDYHGQRSMNLIEY